MIKFNGLAAGVQNVNSQGLDLDGVVADPGVAPPGDPTATERQSILSGGGAKLDDAKRYQKVFFGHFNKSQKLEPSLPSHQIRDLTKLNIFGT